MSDKPTYEELAQRVKELEVEVYFLRKLHGNIPYLLNGKGNPSSKPLSHREIEITKLITEGKLNKEIADLLEISVRTVEKHRANILKKLKLNKTVELVRYAIQNGISVV